MVYLGVTEGTKIVKVEKDDPIFEAGKKNDEYLKSLPKAPSVQAREAEALAKQRLEAFKRSKAGSEFIAKNQEALNGGAFADELWNEEINKGGTTITHHKDGSKTTVIKPTEVGKRKDFNEFADLCIKTQADEPAKERLLNVLSAEELEQEIQDQMDFQNSEKGQIRQVNGDDVAKTKDEWRDKIAYQHLKNGEEIEGYDQEKVDSLVADRRKKDLEWSNN